VTIRVLFFFIFISFFQPLKAQNEYFISEADLKKSRNVNALVRKMERTVEVNRTKRMTITEKRIVTVFNEKGNKALNAYAWYDSKSRKIKSLSAKIYNAQGFEMNSFKESEFKDESAVSGGTLYQDSRVKYLPFFPTSYPYTVVFEKEVRSENTALIPIFYFVAEPGVKVEEVSYSILYDSEENKLHLKNRNFSNLQLEKQITDEGVFFTAKNLPVYKNEDLSLASSRLLPNMMARLENFNLYGYEATKINSWQDLGSWYYSELLPESDLLSEERIAEIKKLTQSIENPMDKAKAIYEYVQGNLRYISVQIGVGGLQPIVAEQVDKVRYGDCKGLSNYTRALLNAVGIESYLAIIEAGDQKESISPDFPNFIEGNHMILAIPDSEENLTWIDCTSRSNPFGFLGDFTDDRYAFVIKPEGSTIVKTPAYLNKENSLSLDAEVSFHNDGKITAKGTIVTKGTQLSNRVYLTQLNQEDLEKRDRNRWSKINNFSFVEHSFDYQWENLKLKEDFEFKGTHFGNKLENRIIFPLNVLNPLSNYPKTYRHRQNGFVEQRGFYDTDSITIKLPHNYKVEFLPENVEFTSEFGYYKRNTKFRDGSIYLTKEIAINKGEYSKEKYEAYQKFRKKIAIEETASAAINKITINKK
jgi:hypothetical protein